MSFSFVFLHFLEACVQMTIRYVLQWILLVWNSLFLFLFCLSCTKVLPQKQTNNSKQSRGCKQELVSERHNARNNLKSKSVRCYLLACLL